MRPGLGPGLNAVNRPDLRSYRLPILGAALVVGLGIAWLANSDREWLALLLLSLAFLVVLDRRMSGGDG